MSASIRNDARGGPPSWAALPRWSPTGKAARRIAVLAVLPLALVLSLRPSLFMAGGIVALIVLWLLGRHPRLALPGMVLFGALVPLDIATGTGSSVNSAMVGVAGLGVLFLARMLLDKRIALRPSEANAPLIGLILSGLLSLVAGAALWNPWVVVKANFLWVQLGQLAVFGLSALAFWLVANGRHGRRELRWLAGIVLFLAALRLTAWFVPGLGVLGRAMNWDGPIWRIWTVALAFALALYHGGLSTRLRAFLGSLVLLVLLGPLLLPATTAEAYQDWASGWLPLAVALMTILTLWLSDRSRWAILVVYAGAAIYGTWVLFRNMTADGGETWSLQTRKIAWLGLFELLDGHWLLGLGPASYWHYWRGILGSMSFLDPSTGYLHFTLEPTVNMHNNYMDILGQLGLVGLVILLWLLVALARLALRVYRAERAGFGRAYAAACVGGLAGMAVAGMLGDWFLPFVYNIGLRGFKDSYLGWLLLGGLTLLDATRDPAPAPAESASAAGIAPSASPLPLAPGP